MKQTLFEAQVRGGARGVTRDEVEDSNAEENQGFNNKMKQMNNKNHPEGEKQAGRRLEHSQHETHMRHTKDNGSAQDCRHKETI